MNKNSIEQSQSVCTPQKSKLMISRETIQSLEVREILAYHVPNKLLSPEKFVHRVMLLFYRFRDEKEDLLSGFPKMYQNKL